MVLDHEVPVVAAAAAVRRVPRPAAKRVDRRRRPAVGQVRQRGGGRPRVGLRRRLERVVREGIADPLVVAGRQPVRGRRPLRGRWARGERRRVCLPAVGADVGRGVPSREAAGRQLDVRQGMGPGRRRGRRLDADGRGRGLCAIAAY